MHMADCKTDPDWHQQVLAWLESNGYAVVTGVLDTAAVAETRDAMYRVQDRIRAAVGQDRLDRAGERGVLRLMMRYDPFFFRFLELPEVLAVVDATVSPTAVLHLQNGFILPPSPPGDTPRVFQHRFHRDFPRVLNGYLMSVNILLTLSPFREDTGGAYVVPGTHQQDPAPDDETLCARRVAVDCPAGSMIVFDSTLQHAAGVNRTAEDRLGINHQFTRSYLKQQLDYTRALPADAIAALPPRSQQLLGWYTRVPTSLDEYYQLPERRLYRAGQG